MAIKYLNISCFIFFLFLSGLPEPLFLKKVCRLWLFSLQIRRFCIKNTSVIYYQLKRRCCARAGLAGRAALSLSQFFAGRFSGAGKYFW